MKRLQGIHIAALSVLACALTIWPLAGCRSSDGQTASVHPRPDGEPDGASLVQRFGGRPPRPCPAIKHTPSDAEASVLVQCTMERPAFDIVNLMSDVKVHITGSRHFSADYRSQDINLPDADNTSDVLTLIGYAKQYACGDQAGDVGKNCVMSEMPNSQGTCWKTNYGEYRCAMLNGGVGFYPNTPPPTAY